MSTVRVPACVGGITLTTSGALVPANNLITTTQAEMQAMTTPYADPGPNGVITTNITTGAVDMRFPSVVTSITINGNVYAVNSGVASAVSGVDSAAFIQQLAEREAQFEMAVG